MRNRTAGLGLKGSDFGATAGDSERDLLKKMVRICTFSVCAQKFAEALNSLFVSFLFF
jgi:hypothetical protein